MALLPIAPVVMPSDLAGQTNGRLDQALLVAVPGGGQLHHLAARAWVALVVNAMAHAAMGLTYTPGGTYRSYGQQETLFRSRYAIGGIGGGCKRWLNALWCKIKAAFATAATPGASNHGWALAIDSAYDDDLTDGISPDDAAYILGHPGWDWLLANAHRFGFSWELQSEPWHIRYVAGDAVPAAVLAWEAFAGGQPDSPLEPNGEQPDMIGHVQRIFDSRDVGKFKARTPVLVELPEGFPPANLLFLAVTATNATAPGYVASGDDVDANSVASFVPGTTSTTGVMVPSMGGFVLTTLVDVDLIIDVTAYQPAA